MKLNTNISVEHILTIITLVSAMAMAFGFLKAEVNYVEDMLELKADKEIIEYKFDVIHAELIEIKEILKEMKE